MATCSYSKLVGGRGGGACGPNVSNPANVQCTLIGECGKDIQGHLKLTNVKDSTLDEAILLLARAGQCFILL